MRKIFNSIGNVLVVIMMLPVFVVGIVGSFLYWSIKFPFWYLNRKLRR